MPKSGAVKIGSDKPRAPRSHPSMVVFTFGARKDQELPFVIGAMADLAGKSKEVPVLAKRQFLEVDAGNLNARMAAMRPRATFAVPNCMSPEGGNLSVDLEFESMVDFTPDRVARRIEPLRKLLEQRERLQNLKGYLDGKPDAEKVLEELLASVDNLMKQGQ